MNQSYTLKLVIVVSNLSYLLLIRMYFSSEGKFDETNRVIRTSFSIFKMIAIYVVVELFRLSGHR